MHETLTLTSSSSKEPDGIEAAALRAEAWAGEPFLRPDEDASIVLAPGTAFRNALDAALAEMEAGHKGPTPEWKVRFALMLGLERVLYEKPPRLASGTELRRHQVDALAGMLTELIAAAQKHENGNGVANGAVAAEDVVEEDEEDEDFTLADDAESEEALPLPHRVPARHLRRGAHRARREDVRRDPQLPPADLRGHDRDGGVDRETGLGRLPGLGRRPAALRCGAARADRPAAFAARAPGGRDQLGADRRSEEHTSELQSRFDLVCRLLLEKKK